MTISNNKLKLVTTDDGTLTQYNMEYGENYHSLVGAKTEALEKFIYPSNIIKTENPYLLDIGFGLGYNALYSFCLCSAIQIVSLEKEEQILEKLEGIHIDRGILNIINSLKLSYQHNSNNKNLKLVFGDARESIKSFLKQPNQQFSHIFLDAFSPSVNPELWTLEFFKDLYCLLISEGLVITYSSSLAVMSGFRRAGFSIFYTPSIGRKRGGIIAFKGKPQESFTFIPISLKDEYLLVNSIQGLPNRDKGKWNKEQIFRHRKKIQEIAVRLGFLKPYKRALKQWEQGDIHG